LAFGTRGQPPKIGRNAALVFEIELLESKRD
jgi:FKBP-type peptidyl-prolyl cis-trans isomerase